MEGTRSPGKHMAGRAWLERVSTPEEVLAGVAKVECAVSMAAYLGVKSWLVGAASIRRTHQETLESGCHPGLAKMMQHASR